MAISYSSYLDGQLQKRFYGKKGSGIAFLKEGETLIVSEGLVNGLSVYHAFSQLNSSSIGLVICGDAGNLKKLASEHKWVINTGKRILIAADYDSSGTGQDAAYEVARAFPTKVKVLLPKSLNKDWNDHLIEGDILKALKG